MQKGPGILNIKGSKEGKKRAGRLKSSFNECLFFSSQGEGWAGKNLAGLKIRLQIIIKINKVNKIWLFQKEPWKNLNLFL
jgi:hypothetical protein